VSEVFRDLCGSGSERHKPEAEDGTGEEASAACPQTNSRKSPGSELFRPRCSDITSAANALRVATSGEWIARHSFGEE